MQLLISQVIAGIATGSLYFLVASGLTLIWGCLGVVNLAHGSLYMVAAFLAAAIVEGLGSTNGFLVALFVVPLAVVVVTFLLELSLFRRIYSGGIWGQLLLTFGLVLVLDDLLRIVFGPNPHSILPPVLLRGFVQLWGIRIARYQLAILAVTLLVAGYLWFLLSSTRTGRLIRAAVDDPEMLGAAGIDVPRLRTTVMLIAAALAAIAGVVAAPRGAVSFGMDAQIIIIAFAIIVIGGLGSVWGAFAGAVLVGIAEALFTLVSSQGSEMVVFLMMILVLIVRPTGFKTIAGRD
jgi:branched-chain amino acid transport system permease protein